MRDAGDPPVAIVGLIGGDCFGDGARTALRDATVVVGSARQLAFASIQSDARTMELRGPLDDVLDAISEQRQRGARVCVLASGDPGFFGIARALGERFGRDALRVHPAPSAVALAFARLGCSWDDALVVSAHGRPLDDAVARVVRATKAAVLTSPDHPPQAVGAALLSAGCAPRAVSVLSRIGEPAEDHFEGSLDELAAGTFDPMSVVVLRAPVPSTGPGLAWGLAEEHFQHRSGMITKSEVRAVALGKLAVPARGVMWDLGAGSGSVAIEVARLAAGIRVIAVESDADSVARIRENAITHAVDIQIVHGRAPEALDALPDPDRVFVGGGGLNVLDAALARLRPGGVVVANYALLDRAAAAWHRLGNVVELAVARGVPTGEDGVRLRAENPVFVCWGPSAEPMGTT